MTGGSRIRRSKSGGGKKRSELVYKKREEVISTELEKRWLAAGGWFAQRNDIRELKQGGVVWIIYMVLEGMDRELLLCFVICSLLILMRVCVGSSPSIIILSDTVMPAAIIPLVIHDDIPTLSVKVPVIPPIDLESGGVHLEIISDRDSSKRPPSPDSHEATDCSWRMQWSPDSLCMFNAHTPGAFHLRRQSSRMMPRSPGMLSTHLEIGVDVSGVVYNHMLEFPDQRFDDIKEKQMLRRSEQ
ncbi:hypothetical protein Tco_1035716 [Tanacetum coccineum]